MQKIYVYRCLPLKLNEGNQIVAGIKLFDVKHIDGYTYFCSNANVNSVVKWHKGHVLEWVDVDKCNLNVISYALSVYMGHESIRKLLNL